MSTFSPELTFIVKRAPYEITNQKVGERLVKDIRKVLHKPNWMLPTEIKLDPMHNLHCDDTTWCVEITPLNGFYWDTIWLNDASAWKTLRRAVAYIFDTCKANGLVPTLTKHRGRTELHYPGGGCHIHYGIGHLFTAMQPQLWYKKMEMFHHNLLMDYTNRPYIRWLFSHWFADLGTSVMVNDIYLPYVLDPQSTPYNPIQRAHEITSTIEPRYMHSTKGDYLTFEVRLFSMVESPDELRLIALFVDAWMGHIKQRTTNGYDYGDETTLKPILLDLDETKLTALKDPHKARMMCAAFMGELGLEWGPYSVFFKRNYLRRIQWGEFV
jgi:hypothetical protein